MKVSIIDVYKVAEPVRNEQEFGAVGNKHWIESLWSAS